MLLLTKYYYPQVHIFKIILTYLYKSSLSLPFQSPWVSLHETKVTLSGQVGSVRNTIKYVGAHDYVRRLFPLDTVRASVLIIYSGQDWLLWIMT